MAEEITVACTGMTVILSLPTNGLYENLDR